jgi:hypothetical protein
LSGVGNDFNGESVGNIESDSVGYTESDFLIQGILSISRSGGLNCASNLTESGGIVA